MVNSLTELAAGGITSGLRSQSARLAATLQASASGNRLNQALTDIASLSVATSLGTQLSGLRAAALNANQASSLLQVADGGLNEISSILDRLSALSVQANSGALSPAGRLGLNAEFQGLVAEIGRLSGETNFNNVRLLDGSLAPQGQLTTSTASAARASGALNFSALNAGNTVVLNGQILTAGTDFAVGANISQTVSNLANVVNTDPRFADIQASATNSTLSLAARSGGEAGNQFTINRTASSAVFTVAGNPLTGAGVFSLQGGTNEGLAAGDVSAVGTVGDSLISNNAGSSASVLFTVGSPAAIAAGQTLRIGNGEGGTLNFTFVTGTPATANEIQIGATVEETLQNAARTINEFSGAGDFGVRQLQASVDGNSLRLETRLDGNATGVDGVTPITISTTTGGILSAADFSNGSIGGIDVSNVTASAFIGQIQGFQASFLGNDRVGLSVQVGGELFRATLENSNSATDQTVRFTSQNGGSFDVTFAGGQGQSVQSGGDAQAFAARLNAAFRPVNFQQTREVSNFSPNGNLLGAELSLQSDDFSQALRVQSVELRGNASGFVFEVEVNGQIFRSENLLSSIDARETIRLQAENGDVLNFTNGTNRIDLLAEAASFTSNLREALQLPALDNELAFQVGTDADDVVQIGIGNTSPQALGLTNLNLLSADAAAEAFNTVGAAINTITSQRANVGAFQQALDFAAANIESALQNQEAARSVLQDTDIAANSTLTAALLSQRQAGLLSLAQTNRLSGNLLQLLQ